MGSGLRVVQPGRSHGWELGVEEKGGGEQGSLTARGERSNWMLPGREAPGLVMGHGVTKKRLVARTCPPRSWELEVRE